MLERQRYFIREHVGLFKMTDAYDILDPDTQEQIGSAREVVSGLVKMARLFINKKLMPTKVEVREKPDDSLVFTLRRPVGLFRQRVDVFDAQGELVGYFKSKIVSIGGGFYVYDKNDKQFAEVKGNWVGWTFKFLTPEGQEMGEVTKKWAGLGKELFTSADNYIVSISDDLSGEPIAKMLLLAAAIAIDVVYYEQGG